MENYIGLSCIPWPTLAGITDTGRLLFKNRIIWNPDQSYLRWDWKKKKYTFHYRHSSLGRGNNLWWMYTNISLALIEESTEGSEICSTHKIAKALKWPRSDWVDTMSKENSRTTNLRNEQGSSDTGHTVHLCQDYSHQIQRVKWAANLHVLVESHQKA